MDINTGEKAEAHLSSCFWSWSDPGGMLRENLTGWAQWRMWIWISGVGLWVLKQGVTLDWKAQRQF